MPSSGEREHAALVDSSFSQLRGFKAGRAARVSALIGLARTRRRMGEGLVVYPSAHYPRCRQHHERRATDEENNPHHFDDGYGNVAESEYYGQHPNDQKHHCIVEHAIFLRTALRSCEAGNSLVEWSTLRDQWCSDAQRGTTQENPKCASAKRAYRVARHPTASSADPKKQKALMNEGIGAGGRSPAEVFVHSDAWA